MNRAAWLVVLWVGCGDGEGDGVGPPGPRADDTGGGGGSDGGDGGDGGGDGGDGGGDGGDGGGDGGDGGGDGGAAVEPPLGATSGGHGGGEYPSGTTLAVDGVTLGLLAPAGVTGREGVPLLLVVSGTEGATTMLSNLRQVAAFAGLEEAVIAVLDGRTASAADGAAALDGLRALYDVDNDRTWLLSESAGTAAGLELALRDRQSWFAAAWFNDVNTRETPLLDAGSLGFAPWGNAGPGGDYVDADAIVAGMQEAGYRLPSDAPYSGPGADTHGSTQQFLEAVAFFADKSR